MENNNSMPLFEPLDPFTVFGSCQSCSRKLNNEELLTLIMKCINFTAIKHKDHKRKKLPYINYVIGVANILTHEANVYDPVVIVSALLYDTIKFANVTFDDIEGQFGTEVCNIVKELTADTNLLAQESKRLQVENVKKQSHKAKLITLASKLYNLRDLEEATPIGRSLQSRKEYFKWTKAVVDACRGTNYILELELDKLYAKHVASNRENCACKKPVTL